MNRPTHVLLVALVAFFTTGVAAADRPGLPKNSPKWLVKDMKKESRKKKLRKVKFASDTIEVQITGKLIEAPEEVDPGVWFMYSNYGGDVDVNCWVITEPRYLFDSLVSTSDSLLDSTAEGNDNASIVSKEVYYSDAGFIESAPYGALERLFLIKTENDEQLLGLQKARAAQRDGVTFVCEHTELGYIKTFEKMFRNFVLNAKIEKSQDKPYYQEQQLISINDNPVGFAQISMTLDADGDTRVAMETGMILSFDKKTLNVMDTSDIEFSYPDGRLINTISSKLEDGTFAHDLQVARDEDSSWLVEGTEAGKEVRHVLGKEEVPLSMLGQMFRAKEAVSQDEPGRSEILIWSADVDISVFTTASLTTSKSKRGKTEAVSVVGPLEMNLIMDESGSTISSETQVSGVSIKTKRTGLEGAVRSPEAY